MYSYRSRYSKHHSYYRKPFHKTKGFCFLIFIIMAITIFIYWSIHRTVNLTMNQQKFTDQDGAPAQIAQINFISGTAQIKSANQPWQEIAENYQINAGDCVRTGASSKALIILPDKSEVRLAENAEIKFAELSASDIVLEQFSGNAYHRVNDQSTAIYRVKNGELELTALGTAFNVLASTKLSYLTVIDGRVKIKIYNGSNIVNMRTIETGAKVTINTSQSPDKMIGAENAQVTDLINDEWFAWNVIKDREKKFKLGLFADMLKLDIFEPASAIATVNSDKLKIKGATDPAAEIYISGQKMENKNGDFETDVPLSPGENKFEIAVKNGDKVNKKILIITANIQKEKIILSGAVNRNHELNLTWKATEIGDFNEFKILQSNTLNPEYPQATNHSVAKDIFQDKWENQSNGHYFFRVCALAQDNKCVAYSNNFEITIGSSAAEDLPATMSGSKIQASAVAESDNIKLTWTINSDTLNTDENFKTIISQSENPVYPGNSYHSLNSNARRDTWQKLAPGKYYFRVCLVKNNTCVLYSNNVSAVAKEAITPITLRGTAGNGIIDLNWTVAKLDVSKGFKIVMDERSNFTFPGKAHHLITSTTATTDRWSGLEKGKTYYFRACQNLGLTVGICSNEITISLK